MHGCFVSQHIKESNDSSMITEYRSLPSLVRFSYVELAIVQINAKMSKETSPFEHDNSHDAYIYK
jgi:hypothetical protein